MEPIQGFLTSQLEYKSYVNKRILSSTKKNFMNFISKTMQKYTRPLLKNQQDWDTTI